jgi:peptide/nickel transport system substrate-binding protein
MEAKSRKTIIGLMWRTALARLGRGIVRATAGIVAIVIFASCSPAQPQIADVSTLKIASASPLILAPNDYTTAYQLWPLVYSCLLSGGKDDVLTPDLASVVPTQANGLVSKDGLTIDYPLRANAKWHDGVPVTAADVVFTYHAIMNPKGTYSHQYPYSEVQSMTAVSIHRLRIRLKHIEPWIIDGLFGSSSCMPIVPKHLLAGYVDFSQAPFNRAPVGSGPYKFESLADGDHLILASNSSYYLGAPKISRLYIKYMPDKNTIVTQLRTGEVDAYFGASPTEASALKDDHDLVVSVFPESMVGTLLFNLSDPVTRELGLRQAIRLAIDREAVGRKVSYGYYDSKSAAREAIGWAYDPTDPQPAYNLQKADALLDNLGWKRGADGIRSRNGSRLQLTLASQQLGLDPSVDVQLQGQLRRVGIDVIIKTYAEGQFFAPASQGGIYEGAHFQMMYDPSNWMGFDSNYAAELDCDQATPKSDNVSRICDPRIDIGYRAANATFNTAIRRKNYALVQKYLFEDVPWIFLWTVPKIDIYTKRLKGFQPANQRTSYYNVNRWRLDPK